MNRMNNVILQSKSDRGFSVTELIAVMSVMAIMAAISVPYLIKYRTPLRTEDQAIKMMDMMREAGQLALTRRRTVRFEIDLTDNTFKVIDEQGANPDTLVKSIPLDRPSDVRVDVLPSGVTRPNPPNYNDITFTSDSLGHLAGSTSVSGHNVWAARFQRDGSVVNPAGTPISVNIYLFPPAAPGSTTPKSLKQVRAITLFGGSGAIRYWKHNGTTLAAT